MHAKNHDIMHAKKHTKKHAKTGGVTYLLTYLLTYWIRPRLQNVIFKKWYPAINPFEFSFL